jgi:hypothetical protein
MAHAGVDRRAVKDLGFSSLGRRDFIESLKRRLSAYWQETGNSKNLEHLLFHIPRLFPNYTIWRQKIKDLFPISICC